MDTESVLDALMRQAANMSIKAPIHTLEPNCCTGDSKWQGYFDDSAVSSTIALKGMSEGFQGTNLRIDELSTIRKLLEQCTIDATRREVIHVLEAACSYPEECIDCPYKNSLGECNRNERIADILLNRFGRVK